MPFQISSVLVAAETIWKRAVSLASDTNFFITNSAMGERQMLPWQINKILIFPIFPVFSGFSSLFTFLHFSLILAYFGISLHIFVINFGKNLVNFKSVPKANLPLGIDR